MMSGRTRDAEPKSWLSKPLASGLARAWIMQADAYSARKNRTASAISSQASRGSTGSRPIQP